MQWWGLNPGPHACWVSTLPTERHTYAHSGVFLKHSSGLELSLETSSSQLLQVETVYGKVEETQIESNWLFWVVDRGLSSPMLLLRFEWPGHLRFSDGGTQQGDTYCSAPVAGSILRVSSGIYRSIPGHLFLLKTFGEYIHHFEYL